MRRELILQNWNGDARKLVEDENKPGEFTFSGFNNLKLLTVGEKEGEEGVYDFIIPDNGPIFKAGEPIAKGLKLKTIIFNDGRYKLITEDYDERIDNKKSQDSIPDDKGTGDDKDVL